MQTHYRVDDFHWWTAGFHCAQVGFRAVWPNGSKVQTHRKTTKILVSAEARWPFSDLFGIGEPDHLEMSHAHSSDFVNQFPFCFSAMFVQVHCGARHVHVGAPRDFAPSMFVCHAAIFGITPNQARRMHLSVPVDEAGFGDAGERKWWVWRLLVFLVKPNWAKLWMWVMLAFSCPRTCPLLEAVGFWKPTCLSRARRTRKHVRNVLKSFVQSDPQVCLRCARLKIIHLHFGINWVITFNYI